MGPYDLQLWFPCPGVSSSHLNSKAAPSQGYMVGAAGRVFTQNCRTAIFGPESLILTCHGFLNYSELQLESLGFIHPSGFKDLWLVHLAYVPLAWPWGSINSSFGQYEQIA